MLTLQRSEMNGIAVNSTWSPFDQLIRYSQILNERLIEDTYTSNIPITSTIQAEEVAAIRDIFPSVHTNALGLPVTPMSGVSVILICFPIAFLSQCISIC